MSAPSSPVLEDRYGAPRRWRRPVLLGVVGVVAAAFLGWLAWTATYYATPSATSELVGYEIRGEYEAAGTVQVQLADDVDPADVSCTLRAFSADKATVGEQVFTPLDGRQTVAVRTERRATAIEMLGCTAPDQPRPR